MQTSCLVLLLTTSLALAQPPAIEWSHQWDVHEYWDACETVRQVPDGGYIAMGWTDYSLAPDAYILRTNPGGGQIWAVTLGEIMPLDYVVSGELTADAGCVITGYREPVEMEQTDLWLVRLSPSGDVLWNRSYGGAYNEGGHCVIETFDGGFAVAGMKQDSAIWSQGWLIKTDASGDTQWTRTIGADLSHIRQTSDGGFLLSRDGNQLVKTDANGNILWTRSGYDGTIRAFELTSDGGIVAAGGSDDFWLAKLNEEGFPIWSRTFGGAGEDRCSDVQQTMDEGFILAGVWDFDFGAYPGGGEAWILKTDCLGDCLCSIVNGS